MTFHLIYISSLGNIKYISMGMGKKDVIFYHLKYATDFFVKLRLRANSRFSPLSSSNLRKSA